MITRISIISGEILVLLEESGRTLELEEILEGLDESGDVVLMSLGWLAREGLIRIEQTEDGYRFGLRKMSDRVSRLASLN